MNKALIVAGILSFLTTSCLKNILCIDGNGKYESEIRNTSSFTEIVNTTEVDLAYHKADTFSITVQAESNLLPHILTLNRNGKIEIRTDPRNACFDYRQKPVVIITSPRLEVLELTGSGDASADTLSGNNVTVKLTGSGDASAGFILCDELSVIQTGSGDTEIGMVVCSNADLSLTGSGGVNIKGTGNHGVMRVTGSGDIRSSDLMLETANETVTGSGDIHTYVTKTLTATISGSGNIYVRGNPVINQSVSGSGRVIRN